MIVGIDPSYSSTGLVIMSDDLSETYLSVKYDSQVEVYNGHDYAEGAMRVTQMVISRIYEVFKYHKEYINVIIEIPALRTVSGAYLAVLHGALDYALRTCTNLLINEIVYVPCTACDSFVRNSSHSKTYLVNYCLDKGWISKRTSHDICTAIIFCYLYKAIKEGKYKNSFWISNPV